MYPVSWEIGISNLYNLSGIYIDGWMQKKCNCSMQHTWWHHQMETFSALLVICAGNSPVPVNSRHKGQWRGALMFSLICIWISGWVNNREAGDLRRYCAHYDVIVMRSTSFPYWPMKMLHQWKTIIFMMPFCHHLFYCRLTLCWEKLIVMELPILLANKPIVNLGGLLLIYQRVNARNM